MISLIVVGSIIGYIFVAGAVAEMDPGQMGAKDPEARVVVGVFWPVTLPFLLGVGAVKRGEPKQPPEARVHD